MRTLTDHQAIREWTVARGGHPVINSTPAPGGTTNNVLLLNFPQPGARMDVLDDEQGTATEGKARVEWPDWFKRFDEEGLAVEVGDETDGALDSVHRIVKRED